MEQSLEARKQKSMPHSILSATAPYMILEYFVQC